MFSILALCFHVDLNTVVKVFILRFTFPRSTLILSRHNTLSDTTSSHLWVTQYATLAGIITLHILFWAMIFYLAEYDIVPKNIL